jgi:predicted house-cleaning NTP pyrophosphatase (Maf/HAM1 superfamily)
VIERVIERGDSLQCCGGFVVDDIELREFIESVVPSFEAVAGLDMDAVSSLMQDMHP